LRKKL
jgi:hypothetical protein